MRAFGILGLILLLLAILILGPYIRRFTEGFSENPVTMTPQEAEEKIRNLGGQIVQLNQLLEDPTLDSSTKDRIIKQKEDLQKEVEKISGVSLPSAEVEPVKPEGFTGVPSNMNERVGKDLVDTAARSL